MDEKTLKRRLLSLLPAASLHMSEFLALASIRLVKGNSITETACVSNEVNPTLYFNEGFLNARCQSDEHLLMLLMHELYHIVLGHTRLFKKAGLVDNIAFDAVINAALCRSFKEEKYVSFFENANSDDSPIGALLRPIGERTPEPYKPLLKELYESNTTTYYELYQKIRKFIVDNELFFGKGGKEERGEENGGGGTPPPFILLGGHKEEKTNPLLEKAAGIVVSGRSLARFFPQGAQRGLDVEAEELATERDKRPDKDQINKMKHLIEKAMVNRNGGCGCVKAFANYTYDGKGAIPNFRDRTALVKMSLGMRPFLYKKPYSMNRYRESFCGKTLVYLDVSDSVANEIGKLFRLLRAPYQRGGCDLYCFSTEVSEIKYGDFKKRLYSTRGGTSIGCVMDHFFSLPKEKRGRRVLILTDGFTGPIGERHKKLLKQEKISLFCGFFGEYCLDDLKDDLTSYEVFGTPYVREADWDF